MSSPPLESSGNMGSPYGAPKVKPPSPYGSTATTNAPSSSPGNAGTGGGWGGVNWSNALPTVVARVGAVMNTAVALASSVNDTANTGNQLETQGAPVRSLSSPAPPPSKPQAAGLAAVLQEPEWASQSIAFEPDASVFGLTNVTNNTGFANSVSAVDIRKFFNSTASVNVHDNNGGAGGSAINAHTTKQTKLPPATASNSVAESGISQSIINGVGGDMNEGVIRLLASIKRLGISYIRNV
jgi:hypothetical protein